MTTEKLLKYIFHMTQQKTAIELKFFFRNLLAEEYPLQHIRLYQLQKARRKDEFGYYTFLVDNFTQNKIEQDIQDIPSYSLSFNKRKIVKIQSEKKPNRSIFPIIENGRFTHFLELSCQAESAHTAPDQRELKQLVQIFANQLTLLNNKDKDPLTELFNRQAYNALIFKIFDKKNLIYKKPYTCLAIMDLDFFKSVNDAFGHLIGDEVLLQFAQQMRMNFRPQDLLFRYGGEEFLCLLQSVNLDQARKALERFREKICQYDFPTVGQKTVSIGFITFNHADNPMRILDMADRALYFAKENGRNQVCSYEDLVAQGKIKPVAKDDQGVDYW